MNPIQQLQPNPAWQLHLKYLRERCDEHVAQLKVATPETFSELQGRIAAYEDTLAYIRRKEKEVIKT